MQISEVSQELTQLRMLTAPFHETFFHSKFIVMAKLFNGSISLSMIIARVYNLSI